MLDGLTALLHKGVRVTSVNATHLTQPEDFARLASCAPHLRRLKIGQWAHVSPAFLRQTFGPALQLRVQDECPGYDDWEVEVAALASGCNYIAHLPLVKVKMCTNESLFGKPHTLVRPQTVLGDETRLYVQCCLKFETTVLNEAVCIDTDLHKGFRVMQ